MKKEWLLLLKNTSTNKTRRNSNEDDEQDHLIQNGINSLYIHQTYHYLIGLLLNVL
jgi:hypothetical protein